MDPLRQKIAAFRETLDRSPDDPEAVNRAFVGMTTAHYRQRRNQWEPFLQWLRSMEVGDAAQWLINDLLAYRDELASQLSSRWGMVPLMDGIPRIEPPPWLRLSYGEDYAYRRINADWFSVTDSLVEAAIVGAKAGEAGGNQLRAFVDCLTERMGRWEEFVLQSIFLSAAPSSNPQSWEATVSQLFAMRQLHGLTRSGMNQGRNSRLKSALQNAAEEFDTTPEGALYSLMPGAMGEALSDALSEPWGSSRASWVTRVSRVIEREYDDDQATISIDTVRIAPEDLFTARELARVELANVIDSVELAPRQRAVLELWLEDASVEETAAVLGISPNTVGPTRSKIRQKLAAALSDPTSDTQSTSSSAE